MLELEDEVNDDDDADVVDDPGVGPNEGKDETDEEDADALADPGIGLSGGVGKFGGKMSGGGLRPPGESSVAPNGMPTRPTGCGRPCASGDEVDAPSRVGVAASGAHASDALPVAAAAACRRRQKVRLLHPQSSMLCCCCSMAAD